ncbi:tyrosine-type recombinase/integrase [Sinorhizobium sp. K101]|nr:MULTISPECIES: tyrosine-type recombinase/integrase [unclassified Sinorhizobium]WEJ11584.1 tyrosine-type recombinase/integrase [Sinorhizobium sp. M103]WEJ16701.1 tyrosine-type recombinase/integrase [Sinorhizobium sp. K101]
MGGKTVGDIVDLYEKARIKKGGKGMKTLPEALRTIRRVLKDYLNLPARQFSKADLRKARDTVAKDAPQMSDRFMSYFGTCWKWAAQEDHIETNFVPDTLKVGPGLVKRERVLSAEELKAIWEACDGPFESTNGAAYGKMVRFLMVMAQRKMEAGKLKHGDILGGRWKQGEKANKSGREHWLQLPPLALDLIGEGKANELVFAGEQGGVIGNFSQLKAELDKLSGVTGWRHHDLRRTASTHLQEQGVAPHIVDAVLNHSIPGVGGHYMHGALNEAKSDAVAAWARELETIIGKDARKAQ